MTLKVKGQGHRENQGHMLKITYKSISLALNLYKVIHKWVLKNPEFNVVMTLKVKGQGHGEN